MKNSLSDPLKILHPCSRLLFWTNRLQHFLENMLRIISSQERRHLWPILLLLFIIILLFPAVLCCGCGLGRDENIVIVSLQLWQVHSSVNNTLGAGVERELLWSLSFFVLSTTLSHTSHYITSGWGHLFIWVLLFVFLQCGSVWGVSKGLSCHPGVRRLIDRTWLPVDPPSFLSVSSSSSSVSLPLSLSLSPLSLSLSSIAGLRSPTRHRQPTGMQRGRSAAWKMAPAPPPRVLWIYPSLPLVSSLPLLLLLLFHALSPCRALRNYPENEGEVAVVCVCVRRWGDLLAVRCAVVRWMCWRMGGWMDG